MRIYAAIQVENISDAEQQSSNALDTGADGIMLVSEGENGNVDSYIRILQVLGSLSTGSYGNASIGVNFLGLELPASLTILAKNSLVLPNIIWADSVTDFIYPEELVHRRSQLPKIWGSIASKQTAELSDNPVEVIRQFDRAASDIDMVVVTGEETGVAPSPLKLSMLPRDQISMICIGSGVDKQNVTYFAGVADTAIVGTSVRTNGQLDSSKLASLVRIAHSL
jgi:predicted TIM-barrel enzyme